MFILADISNRCVLRTALNSGCWSQIDVGDDYGYDEPHDAAATLDECKASCANNYKCDAIGWKMNDAGGLCTMQMTSTAAAEESNINSENDTEITVHYELKRICPQSQSLLLLQTVCS